MLGVGTWDSVSRRELLVIADRPLWTKPTSSLSVICGACSICVSVASEGDNSRGGAKGDAPGRVREGGTPPAQLGGMGERCELPHRGLGLRPRSQRFLRLKHSKNYTKNAAATQEA